MAALDAAGVAALLVELGRRTALAGDNYFRAKAYLRAADTLSALIEPLDPRYRREPASPAPWNWRDDCRHRDQVARHRHPPSAGKTAPGRPGRRARHALGPRVEAGEDHHPPQGTRITDLAALEAAAREDRLKK